MRELAAVAGLFVCFALGCTEVVEPRNPGPIEKTGSDPAEDLGVAFDFGPGGDCLRVGHCDPYDPGPGCECQAERDLGVPEDGGDPYAR